MFFFVFGKIRISIFPIGKKSTFVPKIGGFRRQKSCSDFFNLFFEMKLKQNKFIEILKIQDFDFSNWKKINFCSLKSEKFTRDFPYKFLFRDFFYKKRYTKGSLILLKIGSDEVQMRCKNQYLHISEKTFLWV